MKPFTQKTLILTALFAELSGLSIGQILIPDATIHNAAPPLTADVTTTTTNSSPFGTVTEVLEGKYYRSSDGKTRQDTPAGSFITDQKSQEVIHLNHTTKEAIVGLLPPTPIPKVAKVTPASHIPTHQSSTELGTREVEGFAVHGFQYETRGRLPGAILTEEWVSDELRLILSLHRKSMTNDTVQRYSNIQVGDPDPSVFQVPVGYAVKTAITNPPKH